MIVITSKFLLYDTQTGLWYDVGDEYAREKVSHSLRSRPNEHRRTKPKLPRKSSFKKAAEHAPAIDKIVSQLLHEQQSLLNTMIARETTSQAAATEATAATPEDDTDHSVLLPRPTS